MNLNPTPDVLVLGGGVVGLSIALACRDAGRTVTVLERPHPGMAASPAAAGMLSPLAEASEDGPFLDAGLDSLARYPGWIAELEEVSGLSAGFSMSGKVKVARTASHQARLEALARRMEVRNLPYAWLSPREAATRAGCEIAMSAPALFLERDYHLDPRRLLEVLAVACDRRGIVRRAGNPWGAAAITHEGGRVTGVRCAGGDVIGTAAVVVAAGAWTPFLLPMTPSETAAPRPLRVRPVLGQAILLARRGVTLRTAVESDDVYLVPRGTDHVLAGATVEDLGFAVAHTEEARRTLHEAASRLVPALGEASVADQWSGLRPGTPDALPVIGALPSIEGLTLATGHFRNGFLLAPWTGAAVARLLTGVAGPEIPPAFGPRRPSLSPD
jgi:glycine oxidase